MCRVSHYLLPNKLIHVIDFHRGESDNPDVVTLVVVGVVFDYEDIPVIEKGLQHFGNVDLYKGKVKFINFNTILSGLVVAGIVIIALFAHSFNKEFYDEVITHGNQNYLFSTITIIGSSALAGFLLEMLVIYRERRTAHE
jgi:hypothetical protein